MLHVCICAWLQYSVHNIVNCLGYYIAIRYRHNLGRLLNLNVVLKYLQP